jgi:hypothetical protein
MFLPVLGVAPVSRHPSDAQNFQTVPDFLKNSRTPHLENEQLIKFSDVRV